ncbi:hypothetical protein OSH11_09900 [Kaistia dalseonensis]|uniref:Uncharacterized protein n=1 Tax=Kaistia dalseonensis TaxID=410840 RepID=A0ABU0H5L6_9HYPH|nr:hypothetical protein [Kaistia dalseonensis]MCX5495017.1 hypothetical protein [Kaistia dalseonensis]MDQ0437598.1 hypothetical protein [Kaistia dalseonensis]
MTEGQNDQERGTPYHPEEMRASWDLKVGKSITLQGSARWTPAGVVTAGLAASGMLLALTALVRAARRP